MTVEKIELGKVMVDTGTLVITDPCKLSDIELDDVYTTDEFGRQSKRRKDMVTTFTGLGDGIYTVNAEIIDLGEHVGRRVKRLWIDFINE